MKAFYPAKLPFPLLHVDTTWKFREMIAFRDEIGAALGLDLIVHINQDGLARGINPIASGSALHTQVMKTEGAAPGARHCTGSTRPSAAPAATRRRAAPRSASSRSAPPATPGTRATSGPSSGRSTTPASGRARSIRVFPLSNWTELDIWQYILAGGHPDRAALFRQGAAGGGPRRHHDHGRRRAPAARAGRDARDAHVRFRTLGCYPLTRRDRVRRAERRGHRRARC